MATPKAHVTIRVDTIALDAAITKLRWSILRHQWLRYARYGWRRPLPQLTAGPASLAPAAAAEQFERILRDLAACTCIYHLDELQMPLFGRRTVNYVRAVTGSRFTINPRCPHHGDRLRLPTFSETAVTRDQLGDYEPPWSPWQTTLTDEETHDADPG